MDDAEFQDLLDAHGDDLRQWPAALRLAAERHLIASSAAKASYAAARQLRARLQPTPVRAPKGLADTIMARAFADPAAGAPTGR